MKKYKSIRSARFRMIKLCKFLEDTASKDKAEYRQQGKICLELWVLIDGAEHFLEKQKGAQKR